MREIEHEINLIEDSNLTLTATEGSYSVTLHLPEHIGNMTKIISKEKYRILLNIIDILNEDQTD